VRLHVNPSMSHSPTQLPMSPTSLTAIAPLTPSSKIAPLAISSVPPLSLPAGAEWTEPGSPAPLECSSDFALACAFRDSQPPQPKSHVLSSTSSSSSLLPSSTSKTRELQSCPSSSCFPSSYPSCSTCSTCASSSSSSPPFSRPLVITVTSPHPEPVHTTIVR